MNKRLKYFLIVLLMGFVIVVVLYPIIKHYREYISQPPAAIHRIAPSPEYVKNYSRPKTNLTYNRNPGKYNR